MDVGKEGGDADAAADEKDAVCVSEGRGMAVRPFETDGYGLTGASRLGEEFVVEVAGDTFVWTDQECDAWGLILVV